MRGKADKGAIFELAAVHQRAVADEEADIDAEVEGRKADLARKLNLHRQEIDRLLSAFVERELKDKGIPALSIAVVDGAALGVSVVNFMRSAYTAVKGEQISALAFRKRLKEKISIPMAAGERDRTKRPLMGGVAARLRDRKSVV